MKQFFYKILFAAVICLSLSANAQTTIIGTIKQLNGSNVVSGTIEFIPIDTPKTNSAGEILFGSKTICYINDGKFSAVLYEGLYNCIVGPFNITKQIIIPAGTNVVDLATLIGDTSNSLITFQEFTSLSNNLASMIAGSVAGVSTFNGRAGAVTLTSNDVYAIDIAAEKIKFNTNAYTADANALAFAVLSVDNKLSAATNARGLIIQSLNVDPATNAINSITNHFATTNYVNYRQLIGDTNVIPVGDYVGVFKDSSGDSVLIWNSFETKWVIPTAIGFEFIETPKVNGESVSVNSITNTFATTNYVNTATNNFATTNFVKNYVDSLTVTNSGDSSISLSNITAVYVLSIKSNTTIAPFLNVSASEFRSASLLITNGTGSNCTIKLPNGTSCLGGTTLTVTNAQRRIISVGGIINFTNAVSQALP